MMRLLQAMAGARHGGAEAFFLRLTAAFQRAGLEQFVLVRHEEHAAMLRKEGVAVRKQPFGGILDLMTPYRFRRAVNEYRPDLVLTWMTRATKSCPKGDFVHLARLGGYYDMRHYRHCDHLIGNTRALVRGFRDDGWPVDRTHYLPNFVSAEPAAPLPRAMLGTPDTVPLALAMGRLHPNKGFDVLLAALAKLPDVYLWLAGEGALRPELERQAARLGLADRLRFLGWRSDVPALLAAADLLVCPSRQEPLGNVVIEAWAAGLPVIAAASDGPSELIEEGRTGLLVPIEDAEALAAAIGQVVAGTELRERLVAGGRSAFEAQFTEDRVVAAYRALFEQVLR
jgi:glycosyltransferase involved in cell wall biosynthesis